MPGQRVASLEIELAMATGGAVADLNRFGGVVDKVSAQAIRDLDHIDAAMKGVGGMSGPSAEMVKFAEETARSAVQAARELNRIEKAGETLSSQLTRQIGVYGKTTSEIRAMKVEAAAAAAEQAKQVELATRLRRQGSELYELEVAAAQRAAQATAALAAERAAAAAQAQQAAEREAVAMRQAAAAHTAFEAAARRGMAALREQEAAEAAAAREATQLRAALDPMFAAQQRFDNELERADRLFAAGAISQREYAQAVQLSRNTLRDHAASVAGVGSATDGLTDRQRIATTGMGANRAAMQGLSFQAQDTFTQLSMGANVFSVLAIQGGQAAGQFANLEGKAGSVARFLIGPWGLAITGAMLVLGALTKGLWDGADKSDKLKDKSLSLSEALSKEKFGTEAAMKALKDFNAEKERGRASDELSIKLSLDAARATLKRAEATREAIKASLDQERAVAPQMTMGLGGNPSRAVDAKRLAEQDSKLSDLRKTIANLEIDAAKDYAKAGADPMEAIRQKYKLLADQAEHAAATDAKLRASLGSTLLTYERQEKAAIEAYQETQRTSAKRDAETLTAVRVAKMLREELAGVQITSTTGGKHVDNSYHYRPGGQAIDFVPKGGMDSMSKADVRKVFESRGIDVVELLGPGDKGHSDHFHVAWTKGKLALDGFNDAAKRTEDAARKAAEADRDLAQDLTAVVGRYDPARAAAEEYSATLAKIDKLVAGGKLTIDQASSLRMAAAHQEQERQAADQLAQFQRLFGSGDPLAAGIDDGVRASEQRNDDRGQAKIDEQAAFNEELRTTLDIFDAVDQSAQRTAQGMSDAFGNVGASIGDALTVMSGYYDTQARMQAEHEAAIHRVGITEQQIARENRLFAIRSSSAQVQAYGDMASAAKGFFKEGSTGYQALAAAEKVYRVAQMAMSIQALVQNAAETFGFVAGSAAKATAAGAEGIANQSKLPFPFNIAAMAATGAALVAAGIAVLGGGSGGASAAPVTNTGTGTVLGDRTAQSESITRAIEALREVDTLTNTYAREMANSLRSIESQIGNVASLVVRAGNVDASGNVREGFKTDAIGSVLSKIPVIGGLLGSLFGSKTTVVSNGLYGGAQTVGSIVNDGFDASYYSDVEKKKKFFGITTSTKVSTQYAGADAGLENQFTLILREFNSAIAAAAGPLGVATSDVQNRLNSFVVNIGKVDLKGLTGDQIEEKLNAIFGAAADGMANAAFPGLQRFQKVGEGAFETLVRVASTIEQVTNTFDALGLSARGLGVDAKLGLAEQFESISDMTSAAQAYLDQFYTKEEQAATKRAQLQRVFDSLGVGMPASIAAYRQLVDAQNLTTSAGLETYATLLKLAPAFADLQASMEGARSAADIAAERQDLERRLLELRGDTAAIRALDLAKLDASNRGLQEQVWAVQDAQEAAKAAEQLRNAWASVGDSIMTEVRRIRGLSDVGGASGFAALSGQFNAATAAARGGDQDAAKSLPQLSKALLDAAALQATSRQELDRVQAQTAATLEATFAAIGGLTGSPASMTPAEAMQAAAAASQATTTPAAANDTLIAAIGALQQEVADLRKDNNEGNGAIAGNTGAIARTLDNVTTASGGDAITTIAAAA